MSEEAKKEATRELDRLSTMPPAAAEYSVIKTYLDWLTSLPWNKTTEDNLDIGRARQILDEDHYDLEEVKERIVEYLAVRKLHLERAKEGEREALKGAILNFVGPPGTGKTSLAVGALRAWVEQGTTAASRDDQHMTARDWSWEFAQTGARRAREEGCRRRPAPAWFDTWLGLRSALRAARDEEPDLLRELQFGVRLLVLDDLAIGELTPWREELLSALLGRAENGRRLLLTSNRTLDQLVPYVGDRAADRLRDTARFRVVELTGASRRGGVIRHTMG